MLDVKSSEVASDCFNKRQFSDDTLFFDSFFYNNIIEVV